MSDTQSSHAHRVVDSFKSMLSEDAKSQVTDGHFEELALLIEAAIDASLVEQLNKASAIVQNAVTEIKKL